MMATMTSNVLDDNVLQRQPDRLCHLLLSWGRGGLRDVHQNKVDTVLRPYLAVPAAVDDPRRSVPRFDGIVPTVLPKPVPSSMGELDSELILAAGPAEGLEDPSLLRSLPETPIADALNRLGFTTVEDGQAITVEVLRASDGEFRHRDEMAEVTTAIHDHRLRALFIEDAGTSPQERKNLHRSLKELASSVDAHLGPEDTWV